MTLGAAVLAAALGVATLSPALATPITYTLVNASVNFGGLDSTVTFTGTFTFDPAGPTLTAVDITTTLPDGTVYDEVTPFGVETNFIEFSLPVFGLYFANDLGLAPDPIVGEVDCLRPIK